jgi:hypothetical protein
VRAMNCRSFHKNLEDYLQDGLDFSNRFMIERHAQQCISCGKDLADAIDLRRMVLDLKQVEAPSDFESSLLDKIGMFKAHRRFSRIRRFWIYGPEWLSWRKLMVASSGLAVLVLGYLFPFHRAVLNAPARSAVVANQPEKVEKKVNPPSAVNTKQALPVTVHAVAHSGAFLPRPIEEEIPIIEKKTPNAVAVPASFSIGEGDSFKNQKGLAPGIFEFMITGSDIRPMLPKMIRIQYRPASEEYFIQNVSH